MNGFKLLADTYRKAAEDGKINKDQAEKECRVYDFLANCDEDDINTLFDSAAFNDIAKSYLRKAVKELVQEDIIGDEQEKAVRNRFNLLLSELKSCDVL